MIQHIRRPWRPTNETHKMYDAKGDRPATRRFLLYLYSYIHMKHACISWSHCGVVYAHGLSMHVHAHFCCRWLSLFAGCCCYWNWWYSIITWTIRVIISKWLMPRQFHYRYFVFSYCCWWLNCPLGAIKSVRNRDILEKNRTRNYRDV